MTVIADLAPDGIHISVETAFRHKDLITTIPGARWNRDDGLWTVPLSWTSCMALRGTFGEELKIGDGLTEWARDYVSSVVNPALGLRDAFEAAGDPDLFPHQRADVAWMATVQRGILANQMGTGKSASSVRTLTELTRRGENVFPVLVVCPNSVKYNWAREVEQWWPGLVVSVIDGTAQKRRKQLAQAAHVYVMNYEALRSHSRLAPYGSMALTRCIECGGENPKVTATKCQTHDRELNAMHFQTVIADECFTADTLVSTPHGQRRIADIAVGDVVWGYDHLAERVVPATVTDTFNRQSSTIIDKIGATPNHPYFCVGDGYRAVGDLVPTDVVMQLDEEVCAVRERVLPETPVYDVLLECLQVRGAKEHVRGAAMRNMRETASPDQQASEPEVLLSVVQPWAVNHPSSEAVRSVWCDVQAGAQHDASLFATLRECVERQDTDCSCADSVLLVRNGVQTEKIDAEVLFEELSVCAHAVIAGAGGQADCDSRGAAELRSVGVSRIGSESLPNDEHRGAFRRRKEGLGERSELHQYQARGDAGTAGAAPGIAGRHCGACHQVHTGRSSSELCATGSLLPARDARDRSGWGGTPEPKASTRGRGTRRASAVVGVDRHPLLELRSPEQYERVRRASEVSAEQPVYSLTTSTGNYFADGLLVRNCHRVKDPTTQQTRALKYVSKSATFRYGLTGTPIANNIVDLWSILNFVDPVEWPSKTRWIERLVDIVYNVFGGIVVSGVKAGREDEFAKTVYPRMRRMTKEVVLPFLPPIITERRDVPMTPKQKKAYDQMAEHMMALLDDEDLLVTTNPMTQALRLLQLASSYGEIEVVEETDADGSITTKEKLVLSDPSSKVSAFMDDLPDYEGRKVIVFAASRQLIMLLSKHLEKKGIDHGLIVGNQHALDRQDAIDDFQAGRTRFILATVQAGGTGINLTAADTVVYLQRSWSLIDMDQSMARAHRIGSEKHESILRVDYVAPDTFEEVVIARLNGKSAGLEDIVKDKDLLRKAIAGKAVAV